MGEPEKIAVNNANEHDGTILSELFDKILINDAGRIFFREDAGLFELHLYLGCHKAHEGCQQSDGNKNTYSVTKYMPDKKVPHWIEIWFANVRKNLKKN